jgi:hypothetical protein
VRVKIDAGTGGGSGAPPQPISSDITLTLGTGGIIDGVQNARVTVAIGAQDASVTMLGVWVYQGTSAPTDMKDWYGVHNGTIPTAAGAAVSVDWYLPQDASAAKTWWFGVAASSATGWGFPSASMAVKSISIPAAGAPLAILSPAVTVRTASNGGGDDSGTVSGTAKAHYLLEATMQTDPNRYGIEIWTRWRSSGYTDPSSAWMKMFGPADLTAPGTSGPWSWEQEKDAWELPPDSNGWREYDFRAYNVSGAYTSSTTVQLHITATGGINSTALASKFVGNAKYDPGMDKVLVTSMAGANELPNGGFEEGTGSSIPSWTVNTGIVIDATSRAKGLASLAYPTSGATLQARSSYKISAVAGEYFTLSAYFYRSMAVGDFAIEAECYNAAGAKVGHCGHLNGTATTLNTWVSVAVTDPVACPAGTAYVSVLAQLYYGGASGSVCRVDEITLTRSVTANSIGPAAIASPSLFGGGIGPMNTGSALPSLPDSRYPNGAAFTLTTTQKTYRSTGTAWTTAVDGADVLAASIYASKIAVGQIGTALLSATEIIVGGLGSTCPRIIVQDSSGNTVGLWGDNGLGFQGIYCQRLKVGTSISATAGINANSSGVTITDVPITVSGAGSRTITIDSTNWIVMADGTNLRKTKIQNGYIRVETWDGTTSNVEVYPANVKVTGAQSNYVDQKIQSYEALTFWQSASMGTVEVHAYQYGGQVLIDGNMVLRGRWSTNPTTLTDVINCLKYHGLCV